MNPNWQIYWTFDTADYQVVFDVTHDDDLDLSWDDDGSIAKGLDDGKYEAFVARVQVIHKPTECILGWDTISGCIYESPLQFKRESPYFRDLVRTAILDAREHAKAYRGIEKIARAA